MSAPVEPPPISIPPPPPVRAAAILALVQALGVLVVAVVVILARKDADLKWALATASYFLVLAVLMGAVGRGLLQGRRWARTPAIVLELIFGLVGFYLAVPSEQIVPGIAVMVVGVAGLGLLLSRPANDWISRFPPLFGPTPDP